MALSARNQSQQLTVALTDSEQGQLVPAEKNPLQQRMLPLKIITAMISSGVCATVISASRSCVENPHCGDLWGPLNQFGLFVFGSATNYIAVNTFYSFDSAPDAVMFFWEANKKTKFGIFLFVTSQCMQELCIALGTNSKEWAIIVSVIGAVPGALFTFKNFHQKSWGKYFFQKIYWDLRLAFNKINANSPLSLQEIAFYKKQQMQLLKQLRAGYEYLFATVEKENFPKELSAELTEQLNLLLKQPAMPDEPEGLIVSGLRIAVNLASLAFSGFNMLPTTLNTYNLSGELFNFLPDGIVRHAIGIPLRSLMTAFFGLKSFFTPLFFLGTMGNDLFDVIKNTLLGKSSTSFAWCFHRGSTLLTLTLAASWSIFSYASASTLFEKNYSRDDKEEVLITIDIGTVFLHMRIAYSLWTMLIRQTTRDPRELILMQLQNAIEQVSHFSYRQFAEWVQTEGEEKLRLQPFRPTILSPALEQKTAPNSSSSLSQFSLFKSPKAVALPPQVGPLDHAISIPMLRNNG